MIYTDIEKLKIVNLMDLLLDGYSVDEFIKACILAEENRLTKTAEDERILRHLNEALYQCNLKKENEQKKS